MRHQKTRNKLSRDSAHRKALLMNLSKEIIEHDRIKTTEAKAKAVKPEIDRTGIGASPNEAGQGGFAPTAS